MSGAPARPILSLGIGLACVSCASILIRWCQSPAAAIATWRVGLAAILIGSVGLASPTTRRQLLAAVRDPWTFVAGVLLAAHFLLWIRALQTTTVAASTFLLAVQVPVSGVVSWLALREPPRRLGVLGMALSTVGIGALAGTDLLTHGARSGVAAGDGLAILSGVAYVGYVAIGRRVRARCSIVPYLAAINGWAAVALASAAVLGGWPLLPTSTSDWPLFVLLAVVPTIGGHGLFNHALAHVRVYVVNLVVMAEPVVASGLAWLVLAEAPPLSAWLGAPWILAGAALAIGESRTARHPHGSAPTSEPVEPEPVEPADGPASDTSEA